MFLHVALLLLDLDLGNELVVVESDHLLLQHLKIVLQALQFKIFLLLLAVLHLRFPGPNSFLKTESLLLARRKHGSVNGRSLLTFSGHEIDLDHLVSERAHLLALSILFLMQSEDCFYHLHDGQEVFVFDDVASIATVALIKTADISG